VYSAKEHIFAGGTPAATILRLTFDVLRAGSAASAADKLMHHK
jgi:hypothetical protein